MLTTKLTNIANAIRNKTQTSVAMTLDEMPSKIEGISTAENLTEELSTYNTGLTIQETTLENIVKALEGKGAGGASKYAPRHIYTISFREYEGTELEYELNNLDTTNVLNMGYMFYNCRELTSLDLSKFDTSNTTRMSSMFEGCRSLTSLDLSNFNTSEVYSMSDIFSGCTLLMNLDIRNFDFTNVTSYSGMFNRVPTDCLIIVKDETAKEWITSKFTTLTNVKTVAEL